MVLPHSFFDGTASKTEAASLTEPYTEKMNPTPSFFTKKTTPFKHLNKSPKTEPPKTEGL